MHRHYFVLISNWFEIISGIFFLFDILKVKVTIKNFARSLFCSPYVHYLKV